MCFVYVHIAYKVIRCFKKYPLLNQVCTKIYSVKFILPVSEYGFLKWVFKKMPS